MDAMNTAAPAGARLRCATCGTEIVVVKPATGPLACCGRAMANLAAGPAGASGSAGPAGAADTSGPGGTSGTAGTAGTAGATGVPAMPNQLGKRYTCATCGATVLVTKAGDGGVACREQPTEQHQAKPLPSSD